MIIWFGDEITDITKSKIFRLFFLPSSNTILLRHLGKHETSFGAYFTVSRCSRARNSHNTVFLYRLSHTICKIWENTYVQLIYRYMSDQYVARWPRPVVTGALHNSTCVRVCLCRSPDCCDLVLARIELYSLFYPPIFSRLYEIILRSEIYFIGSVSSRTSPWPVACRWISAKSFFFKCSSTTKLDF